MKLLLADDWTVVQYNQAFQLATLIVTSLSACYMAWIGLQNSRLKNQVGSVETKVVACQDQVIDLMESGKGRDAKLDTTIQQNVSLLQKVDEVHDATNGVPARIAEAVQQGVTNAQAAVDMGIANTIIATFQGAENTRIAETQGRENTANAVAQGVVNTDKATTLGVQLVKEAFQAGKASQSDEN